MKYCLTFQCGRPVELCLNYNKILQAAILTWLGCNDKLVPNEDGTIPERAYYQWYTFSQILGKRDFNPVKNKLVFYDRIQLVLGFPDEVAHDIILKNLETCRPLRFGQVYVDFIACDLIEEQYVDECVVETLSPLAMHVTYEKPDGRNGTYYYSPMEKEFSELLRGNLLFKYESIYGRQPENTEFMVLPVPNEKAQRVDVWLNDFYVRAWHGRFILKGSPELIKLVLHSGLGTKNNLGLGCVIQL